MSAVPSDLVSSLKTALDAGGPAWLPGIARPLVLAKRQALAEAFALAPGDYGTARMLHGGAEAERDVVATIALPQVFDADGPIVIETLRREPARRYVDLGLVLGNRGAAAAATCRLREAFACLGRVPEVAQAVGALLSVVHVAVPEGEDYDVSFSDPLLPFSIFVGIADERGRHSDLRLAEGILHECMHLQLTLIEGIVPMVSGSDAQHYSPWQNTMRPAQGVLHGIYVFAVIHDFMAAVSDDGEVDRERRRYIAERIVTCRDEISGAADSLLAGDGLSEVGRSFVQSLRR